MARGFLARSYGVALKNNATTNNIAIGSAALATAMNSAYTVSIWFKRVRLGVVDGMFRDQSGDKFWFNFQTDGRLRVYHSDLTPASVTATNVPPSDMNWHHHVATYDGSSIKLYTDGVQVGSTSVTGTLTLSSDLRVPDSGGGALGLFDEVRVWNRALTATEVSTLYNGIASRNGLIREYLLDNISGTTAYDTSISAANATITGSTVSKDTVTSLRKPVYGNQLFNGDFELYPPFTAATNAAPRWIDGTTGSTTNDTFGWSLRSKAGTVSAKFDTTTKYSGSASMKLSTESTGAYVECCMYNSGGNPTQDEAKRYFIPVKSSTSYTCTYKMKTNFVSGDATTGASVSVRTYASAGGSVVSAANATGVKTTTDWTSYTTTITTGATISYIEIVPFVYGHQGTATLIMDAWFDDIELKPTTPVTRSTAVGRSAA